MVSSDPMVLYEKIFDLSRKSMLFTSFLLEQNLSGSRPVHDGCGQYWNILRLALFAPDLFGRVSVSGTGSLCF